ncbi:Peptidyl-prolyl cis-trans isomerase CYP26-2, chloroplastic [Cucurbita argyrosperma subsp. argyrosperma]|nr:Peptidyl-prolyl cis-trans isomerase CYP26-2, chloroplastic [Cucurbita argyrosperma subsp. argyrosperma]
MTSMAVLSRRLFRSLLSNSKASHHHDILPVICSSKNLSFRSISDIGESSIGSDMDLDSHSVSNRPSLSPSSSQTRTIYNRPLENGLDAGIYKAILVGQVGQSPLQKQLKSGRTVTLLSVGTGGIRNNRRPLANEEPREYANRCAVQWHRVSIYPQRLGDVVMKHVVPGSILYLEGNLETKIFTDSITGLVRRIREVAIRRSGRLVFLGKGEGDVQQSTQSEFKDPFYTPKLRLQKAWMKNHCVPKKALVLQSLTKRAFIDISVDGEPAGRIIIGLYGDDALAGVARFTNLVSGAAGISYRRKDFVKITSNYVQDSGVRSYGVDVELAKRKGMS